MAMFGGRTLEVDVGDCRLFARSAHVAPLLASRFTVVCADLRGYGWSGCPPSSDDHAPYAKRGIARDMVALMEALGFPRFSLAGHDRGGRVAYRLALDHPSRLERLALLDILPGTTVWQLADERFALGYWPWTLLAQDAPLPERLISGAPDALVAAALSGWGSPPGAFDAAARAAYVTMLSDSEHVHAICASWYESRGGPLALWQPWCERLEGRAVEGGHFFPEANPRETAALLERFLSSRD